MVENPSSLLQLPAIPIREGVLFPNTESVLSFGRPISLKAIKGADKASKLVVLLTQKDNKIDTPNSGDLYDVGTLAVIERSLGGGESVNALVRGMGRVKVTKFDQSEPFFRVSAVRLYDIEEKDEETKALVSHLQKEFRKSVLMGKPVEFLNFMKLMGGVKNGELVDQISSTLNISTPEKQELLEITSVKQRIQIVIQHLAHEMKVMEIEKDVVHKTQKKFDKNMRENVLRERLRTIQKELGEIDEEEEIAKDFDIIKEEIKK